MEKTAEDFRLQAEKENITEWFQRRCAFCKYPMKYLFQNGEVLYDSGCDCVSYPYVIQKRSWEDIAEGYNMQTNPEVIEIINNFWKF